MGAGVKHFVSASCRGETCQFREDQYKAGMGVVAVGCGCCFHYRGVMGRESC